MRSSLQSSRRLIAGRQRRSQTLSTLLQHDPARSALAAASAARPPAHSIASGSSSNTSAAHSFKRPRARYLSLESTPVHESSARFNNPTELTDMREAADRLCCRETTSTATPPPWADSPEPWFEAENVLEWWASQRTPESVERSFEILQVLVKNKEIVQELIITTRDESISSTNVASDFIDRDLMNAVAGNWQQCWKTHHQTMTDEWDPKAVLKKLDDCVTRCGDLQVSGKALSLLIDGTVRHAKTTESATFCEYLLDRMTDPTKGATGFVPSVGNLNAGLKAWAKSGDPNAHVKAEALLDRMSDYVQSDAVSYNTVIHALAVAGKPDRAEALLNEMVQAWTTNPEQDYVSMPQPNRITFNTVIAAWARSNHPDAAERAQSLLKRMCDQTGAAASLGITPDIITINTVMDCWARSGHEDAADRSLTILEEMKELSEVGEIDAQPDVISYTTVINAFAKAGRADQAEKLLGEMHRAFMSGDVSLKPNGKTLTAMVEAWSRSDAPDSVQRAEAAFRRISELYEMGLSSSGPDVAAYNVMLNCYANSSRSSTMSSLRDAAKKADTLLQEMKERGNDGNTDAMPDFRSYSIVIDAWVHALNDRRAAKMLEEALDLYEMGNQSMCPGLSSVHAVLRALGRPGKGPRAEAILMRLCDLQRSGNTAAVPNAVTFSLVLSAWSRAGEFKAAHKAEAVFERMRNMHDSGELDAKPDFLVYSTLISCWANSKLDGASDRAVSLLGEMQQRAERGESGMEPDVVTYNSVLRAFKTPEQAEDLLWKMYNDYHRGKASAKPDLWSFNTVLSAWAKSNTPYSIERSETLVSKMLKLHKHKKLDVNPDTVTYNNFLNCLANSKRPGSAERAESMLRWMTEEFRKGNAGLRPSKVSYVCVIKAWVYAGVPERAEALLRVLITQYQRGNADMKPDKTQFKHLADAWNKSIAPGSSERALAVLRLMHETYPSQPQQRRRPPGQPSRSPLATPAVQNANS